jgi:glycosyltransferase-like protein
MNASDAAPQPPPSLGLFTYSTHPRGSVVHTAYLADALQAAGWDVTVYALDKDGRGFFRPLRARLCLVPAWPAPVSTAALVRQRATELTAYLRTDGRKHDLYHAQDCLTANALLELPGSRLLVRTVHHVEHFVDPELAACQERSIKGAALCLAVSETAAREVQRSFGVRTGRVSNGVAIERFDTVDARRVAVWQQRLGAGVGPLILAVGGVEERKNTARILGAFARIHAQQPGARLWILGGASVLDHGAYRAHFASELALLPLGTRSAVTELGVVPDADVPALFRVASALALPSLQEGFGLAALEALAAGLPAVVSAAPPFTEYLDESCAVMVDPLSEEAIAEGLRRAIAAPAALVVAGRRRAYELSWRRVARMHIEHYKALLAGAPALTGPAQAAIV